MSKVVENAEKRITQNWGNGGHGGIDIGFSSNEEFNKVHPNCKGVVVEVVDNLDRLPNSGGVKSWGNYVLIKHANGMYSRYAHLKKGLPVRKGQEVNEHTLLGIIGESGNTFGRHLHFEVSKGYSSSTRIDPTPYLTKAICEDNKQTEVPTTKFKYNVGDKVVFTGTLYVNAKGDGAGQSRTNFTAIITKRAVGSKPYNLNNGLGWVAESDLKLANQNTARKYIVKSGDTVASICRNYYKKSTKTEWDKIRNVNKLNDSYLIRPGQTLIIP